MRNCNSASLHFYVTARLPCESPWSSRGDSREGLSYWIFTQSVKFLVENNPDYQENTLALERVD
jgi:hypothetical protein